MQLPAQTMALGDHDVVEVVLQGGEVSHLDRGNQGKGGIVADYGVGRAGYTVAEECERAAALRQKQNIRSAYKTQ
jgi:hypothetical protein